MTDKRKNKSGSTSKRKVPAILKSLNNQRYIILSLIATPFIIFGVTSIDLYLANRIDLESTTIVLLPFLVIILAAVLAGWLLYRYQEKHKGLKILLLTYYMLGPIFILFTIVRPIPTNTTVKALILLAALFMAVVYAYRKIDISKLRSFMGVVTLALVAWQVFIVLSSLGAFGLNGNDSAPTESGEVSRQGATTRKLPNVYHIVLDEYQTDMFELTLDKDVKKELGGFVYYPENTTVYGRTGMSLPTIFTGLSYDYEDPQITYQQQAFGSEKSILYWLKQAGYKTRATIHKIYTFDLPLFDDVSAHKGNAKIKPDVSMYTRLFLNLWVYANTPGVVSENLADPDFLEQIEAQNVLPDSAPVVSYRSFNNIIDNKKALDEDATYTFVHLILPHFPYVLNSDCSYIEGMKSAPIEQSECATGLILKFADALKEIDRYDDSLIIIQSDHGGRFKVENNDLVNIKSGHYSEEWSLARARSLMLIKTPERNGKDSFMISGAETSLLDVAPTIAEATGIKTDIGFEGFSLSDPDTVLSERVRYYHFFKKKGKNEYTDELSRYILRNGNIHFDKIVPINE